MLFAINYSQPANELLETGRITIDRFKCPDWPDLIDKVKRTLPVAVHFNLLVGSGKIAETDWNKIDALAEITNTPFINVHLGAMAKFYPDVPLDNPSPRQSNEILDQIAFDVNLLVERYGAQRIIIENVPYQGTAGEVIRTSVDPEIISKTIQDSGCGFLFDLAHARICAYYLGMDEWEYVKRLPLTRLKELHITGVQFIQGILRDHLELAEADWSFLDRVLEHIHQGDWPQPWLTSFEYGGLGDQFSWRSDPEVIAEQTPILYRKIHLFPALNM